MAFAVCEVQEFGQIAVAIEPHMQLDGPFGLAECGPWKNREAQIDNRGIEEIQLAVELEAVPGRELAALLDEFVEYGFIQGSGLLFIDPGKGCS